MEHRFLKKLVLFIAFSFCVVFSEAQEIINIDRYQQQMPMINPALSGAWSNEMALGLRWTVGDFRQLAMPIVRIDGFVPDFNSGFGISVTGNAGQIGDDDIYVRANYNYQIPFKNKAKLSLGTVLEFGRTEHQGQQNGEATAGFGFAYIATNWHVGVAVQQLVPLYNQGTERLQNPLALATAHYVFMLSESLYINPEVLIGVTDEVDALYNIGVRTKYKTVYAGVYRIQDPYLYESIAPRWGFSAGVILFKFLNLDYNISVNSNSGSRHSITLRIFKALN
jgi:hypothetical protein